MVRFFVKCEVFFGDVIGEVVDGGVEVLWFGDVGGCIWVVEYYVGYCVVVIG